LTESNHFIKINDKIKKIKQKIIRSFEAFCDLEYQRQRLLMTTQAIKAIKVLSIMATVTSQILCQLTAKVICELKSLNICRLRSQGRKCRLA